MADVKAFYGSLGVDELDALRRSDQLLEAIEEDDAEGTFRKGDALLLAHGAVPEGRFREWCSRRWAYHRTYAYDHMRVAQQLAPLRTRLVRAGVAKSSLLELGKKPEMAEAVAAAYEARPRPTVAKVKAMIGAGAPAPGTDGPGTADVGGLRGLGQLHAAKRKHLRAFADRLERMIGTMEAALAAPRVLKGELAAAVNMEARWAQAELRNLCAFIEPAPWDKSKPAPVPFPEGSGWGRTMTLLYELGGSEQWPPKDGMADWLRQTVLPLLEWAARGGAVPSGGSAAPEPGGPLPPAAASAEPIAGEEGGRLVNCAGAGEAEQTALATEAETTSRDGCGPGNEREEPPLLNAASVANCASFLSFLRQRHSQEGVPPEAVEDTCRSAAQALTSSLGELGSIGAIPACPPSVVALLADSIYRASQGAPPTVPFHLPAASAPAGRSQGEGADPGAVPGNPGWISAAVQVLAQQAVYAQREGP